MGLTSDATGRRAASKHTHRHVEAPTRRIALAGAPNVGKSSIFNGLTGSHQHTGNWQGKTVEPVRERCRFDRSIELTDLPGCRSLLFGTPEEECARQELCSMRFDTVIVVCDATNPTRGLSLVLQILEITPRVIVCMNLMDEAEKRGTVLSLKTLSRQLGVPVIGTSAHRRADLLRLSKEIQAFTTPENPYRVCYPAPQEAAIAELEKRLSIQEEKPQIPTRFAARWLLEAEALDAPATAFGQSITEDPSLSRLCCGLRENLLQAGLSPAHLRDSTAAALMSSAEELTFQTVLLQKPAYREGDLCLDHLFTGKKTAFPLMLLLLMLVFFLTVTAANIPSSALGNLFGALEKALGKLFLRLSTPAWLQGLLLEGMLRTLGWVVSVMLPPMVIFFPLFALLEDAGYLPRVAYNLDRPFCRCSACGKQALTMCMGFGCNAAGVVGCRIINSPRERLLAILTNSFVPCNGRFPALLAILSMFLLGSATGFAGSLLSAALLCALILLSVGMTLLCTKLLSLTLLRGAPSAFVLELPPYRRPPILRTVWHSLSDRALSLLGRAAAVAAPAGLLLWLLANCHVGDANLLQHAASFLEPIARPFGLDGVILIAFLLGLPANEIIIPIMLMIYLSGSGLAEASGIDAMRQVLVANGWSLGTAISVLLLFLFHSPCSTTLLTVKKETGSRGMMLLSAILPSAVGLLLCFLWTAVWNLIQ